MQSSSRAGATVIWLAVHTTEGIMRAADLLAWTTWAGSSHASNDELGTLLTPADGFVPYDRAAWTLRNANPISENIEQCGWARWTREEWLARPLLLETTARWLGERSVARGIPLRRLADDEIRNRVPGVLGHGDYSRATGDGNHTDPGPNYPWDYVLDLARTYAAGGNPTGDVMDARQEQAVIARLDIATSLASDIRNALNDPRMGALAQLARISAVVGTQRPDIDQAELARNVIAGLVPVVLDAVGKSAGLTMEQVTAATEKAVRAVFADAAA